MQRFIWTGAIAAGLLLLPLTVQADPLFSQGPPNGNNFDITDYRLADDFSVPANESLDHIGFWYQAQDQSDLAAVTYAVYQDRGGALGALLGSGTINNPNTSYDSLSGLFFGDFPIAPLAVLGGSTYWLELHAGASLTDTSGFTVSWAAADDNATQIALANYLLNPPDSPVNFSGFDQYAFDLGGTPVPEPALAALILPGLLLLLLVFLKSQRREIQ
jgi:hypothetical protein